MTTTERLTYSVQGGTLSVLAAGPQDGERIVLLHGIPANAHLFREVLPILAEAGYRALAPDMPGYGGTRLSDSADYSLSAVADLYAQWLDAERLAPVWLVGHDLGGAVAQFMAVRDPQVIRCLTLGNCPFGDSFPVAAVTLAILAARTRVFAPLVSMGLIPNPYMNREVRRGFRDRTRLTREQWQTVFWDGKVKDAEGRREFARHLKHLRNAESVAIVPQIKLITIPTLVLWSERDRHQPVESSGSRLLAALPEGTPLEVVAGAGHFMPLEAPQDYAHKLITWRASLTL
jgi:pimeloyl-ACP methyl ester carboxylesterase